MKTVLDLFPLGRAATPFSISRRGLGHDATAIDLRSARNKGYLLTHANARFV